MRKPEITRTFNLMLCKCLVVDVSKQSTKEEVFLLPRPTSEKKLLSTLKEFYETEDIKIVNVLETKSEIRRFAMSEDVFINHAREIALLPNYKKENE